MRKSDCVGSETGIELVSEMQYNVYGLLRFHYTEI